MLRRFVFLAILFAAGPASAGVKEVDAALFKTLFNSASGKSGYTVEQRLNLAREILKYWQEFDAVIPRNQPSEIEWLKNEFNSNESTRISRAINSPIYGRSQLVSLATTCVNTSTLVLNQVGQDKMAELYAWMKMLQCYSDTNSTIGYLQMAELSNGMFNGPVPMMHGTALHSLITGELTNSIVAQ